jgi:hypothetical protein
LKGLDNGTDVNGASYSSPDFSGQGKALDLDRNLNQYVRLPRSLNLAVNTSFTVGVWVLLTASNWITILSDCNAFNSVCIGFIIRSINIYAMIFNWTDGNLIEQVIYDADGLLCQSCWMHLAFSYNNKTDNLSIYFDGLLMKEDKFMLNNISKLGTNGNKMSYIGQNSVVTHNDPFDGLIDQLSISYHVKNASEILDEATLLCDRAGTGPVNRYRSGRTGTGPDRTGSEIQPGRKKPEIHRLNFLKKYIHFAVSFCQKLFYEYCYQV